MAADCKSAGCSPRWFESIHSHVYVYALIDPRDGEIRYVGKTHMHNLAAKRDAHVRHALAGAHRNLPRFTWMRKLHRMGYVPEIVCVQQLNRDDLADAERYWIKYFTDLGCRLTNVTAGGDGFHGRHTAEAKRKIAEAQRGRKWSDDERQKLSAAQRAMTGDALVRHREGAQRGGKRAGDLQRGVPKTAEHNAKVATAITALPRTPCAGCGKMFKPAGHGRHKCTRL